MPAGDHLGPVPSAAFAGICEEFVARWQRNPGARAWTVHLPLADITGRFALGLTLYELVVHSWDISVPLGRPIGLDDDAVMVAEDVFRRWRGAVGSPGAHYRPPRPTLPGAAPLDRLLAMTGREPLPADPDPDRVQRPGPPT
jgi:uncharacterized protein (TIGR03086 family)